MTITEQERKAFLRRILIEVAHRLDIRDPEGMEEDSELLPAIERKDHMAMKILGAFRSAFRRWHDKGIELERSATQGLDVTGIRVELMGLMTERDVSREAMIRYLDHHYPRSVSRVAV